MSEDRFRTMYKHKLYMEREMNLYKNNNKIRTRTSYGSPVWRPCYGTYSTVYRVPQHKTYAEWVSYYNSTKPIRGRDEVWRPLGERRSFDTLSFRVANEGSGAFVGFRMHNVEIMRWYADESIHVMNRSDWLRGLGCEILKWLIPNMLGAYTKQRIVMAKYATEARHFDVGYGIDLAPVVSIPVSSDSWFVFRKVGEFYVPKDTATKSVVLNRGEVKRIEEKYKAFTIYVRLCLNTAKVESNPNFANISAEMVGPYATQPLSNLERTTFNKSNPKFTDYLAYWLALVQSDEVGDWQKAFGMLLATQAPRIYSGWHYGNNQTREFEGGSIMYNIDEVTSNLREILLRAHSEEVLTLRETKAGSTPSTKYADWVVRV